MSKVLEALTTKLTELDDVCAGPDTRICFERDDAGFVTLQVPATPMARTFLRALLVEVGRHEQARVATLSQVFDVAVVKNEQ
jgi:hypothetical protein